RGRIEAAGAIPSLRPILRFLPGNSTGAELKPVVAPHGAVPVHFFSPGTHPRPNGTFTTPRGVAALSLVPPRPGHRACTKTVARSGAESRPGLRLMLALFCPSSPADFAGALFVAPVPRRGVGALALVLPGTRTGADLSPLRPACRGGVLTSSPRELNRGRIEA